MKRLQIILLIFIASSCCSIPFVDCFDRELRLKNCSNSESYSFYYKDEKHEIIFRSKAVLTMNTGYRPKGLILTAINKSSEVISLKSNQVEATIQFDNKIIKYALNNDSNIFLKHGKEQEIVLSTENDLSDLDQSFRVFFNFAFLENQVCFEN